MLLGAFWPLANSLAIIVTQTVIRGISWGRFYWAQDMPFAYITFLYAGELPGPVHRDNKVAQHYLSEAGKNHKKFLGAVGAFHAGLVCDLNSEDACMVAQRLLTI